MSKEEEEEEEEEEDIKSGQLKENNSDSMYFLKG